MERFFLSFKSLDKDSKLEIIKMQSDNLKSYLSVDKDFEKNIMAIWHKESHLNRHFIDNEHRELINAQEQKFLDVYNKDLAVGAIINEFKGFKEDYLIIHCLLKKHKNDIKKFFEIGTSLGVGTNIIKNALGNESEVLSLDLPAEVFYKNISDKTDRIGTWCDLPFTQLRGDSLILEYSNFYPLDGWFIDGEHDYEHSFKESMEAFKSGAKLIIWHDSDIEWVRKGINDAIKSHEDRYDLYRVIDTRIAYAVRK